jgi:hypothetical protein
VIEHAKDLLLAIHPDSTLDLIDLGPERAMLDELRANPLHVGELLEHSVMPREMLEAFLFAAIVTRQLLVPGQAKPPMGIRPTSVRSPRLSPFPQSGSSKPPLARTEPQKPVEPSPQPQRATASPHATSAPVSVRTAIQKKISWSDLLAVRRPPSHVALQAQTGAPPQVVTPPQTGATRATPPQTGVPTGATPPQTGVPTRATPRPASPTPLSGSAAEAIALVRRAEQALAHKDIQGAVRTATRAVERDPNVPQVNAFFAWVRVIAGDIAPAQAIVMIDRALAQDEACTPARLYRAKLLKRDDRVHEAMREFELVLAAEPENREAQSELRLLMLTVKPSR